MGRVWTKSCKVLTKDTLRQPSIRPTMKVGGGWSKPHPGGDVGCGPRGRGRGAAAEGPRSRGAMGPHPTGSRAARRVPGGERAVRARRRAVARDPRRNAALAPRARDRHPSRPNPPATIA
jgi:hypothetical protein